jgi:hypothetical protein
LGPRRRPKGRNATVIYQPQSWHYGRRDAMNNAAITGRFGSQCSVFERGESFVRCSALPRARKMLSAKTEKAPFPGPF